MVLSTICTLTRDVYSHGELSYASSMAEPPTTLGIIAGNRCLPLLVARQARATGVKKIVAVAFENETDRSLADLVDLIVWVRVGQLGRLISVFKDENVGQCVMAGQIAPKNLFDLRPDMRAVKLLLKLKEKNAHSIFGAIAEELRREGIELVEATPWLRPFMAPPGYHAGPKLNSTQQADVAFGFRIAKEVSSLEIGQLIIVKEGTILAVEGIEGTDQCLARGGELAGRSGGAVAVKVAKEKHDMRFDIPCVGLKTVETCAQSGVSVLALEAGKTLILDGEKVNELAQREKISIVAVS
jgi:UDP-2,3-diacylglucosamine hydrolase